MAIKKIKTILITGATGRLGKLLTNSMLKDNYEIYVLVRDDKKIFGNRLKYLKGDLTDKNLEIPDVDLVIHLAAKVDLFSRECIRVNYIGTKNLLSKLNLTKGIYFLFFSTIDAFGMTTNKMVSGNNKECPFSVYGQSKLMAEKTIKKFAIDNGSKFRFINLRIGNVTGLEVGDLEKTLTILSKNKLATCFLSGYELNVINSEKIVKLIKEIISKKYFLNQTRYVVDKSVSLAKINSKSECTWGMWLSWLLFRLLSIIGKGGVGYYLTNGGLKKPYRRYSNKIFREIDVY